jgi:RNA polymerase primary sigma factor
MATTFKSNKRVNFNNSHLNNYMSFVETEEARPYILQARRFPPYNREEEIAAIKKAKSGKQTDIDEFINHNLLLAVVAARHFMHVGVPLADLIQYANIGLIKAARAYIEHPDYYLKNRFNTYAVWYIRKYITEGIEEYQMIAKPHMLYINSNKVKDAIEHLTSLDSEIIIDVEKLSEYLGLTMNEVKSAVVSDTTIVSTDTVIGTDDDKATTLGDIMLKSDMNADDAIMEEDKGKQIEMLLNHLNNREKVVVKMTFGIGYDYEREPESIARELGLGAERVRQILKGAMVKLQSAASTH